MRRLNPPNTKIKEIQEDSDKDLVDVAENNTETQTEYSTDELTAGNGYLVPSGCHLLNLALTNNVSGAYQTGRIVNVIGDTHAGKTLLTLTGLAEVAHDPAWDDYSLDFKDFEHAMSFPVGRLFGKKTFDRIVEARLEEGYKNITSYEPPRTAQEWYKRILKRIKTGKPFISVVDSWDSIVPEEEYERSEAVSKDKKEKGSYKNERSRLASEYLRVLSGLLTQTNSLLILISQTRENLDPMSFKKKKRSGGSALDFYSSYIYWLTKIKSIYGSASKKDDDDESSSGAKAKIGRMVGIEITKTKTTGFEGKIEIPIYRQIGVDTSQANIDFIMKQRPDVIRKDGAFLIYQEQRFRKMELCELCDVDPDWRDVLLSDLQEAWNGFIRKNQIQRTGRFSS